MRLGIQAPKHVVIDRAEVRARKQQEHMPNVAATPAVSSIGSAASERRDFHSPSVSDPEEKRASRFSTERACRAFHSSLRTQLKRAPRDYQLNDFDVPTNR